MQVEMKYIQHWTDHLGRKRYRLRRRGFKRVELPVDGDPDSVEFQAAYYAALRGEKPPRGGRRGCRTRRLWIGQGRNRAVSRLDDVQRRLRREHQSDAALDPQQRVQAR